MQALYKGESTAPCSSRDRKSARRECPGPERSLRTIRGTRAGCCRSQGVESETPYIASPFPAVGAVLNHGFAVLSDTTNFADPFGQRVIAALAPYDDVKPHIDYVAHHHVIVDRARFPMEERSGRLAQAIEALT